MNVNSRGHNLDTRFDQLFPEIKHPPGPKNLVGVPYSSNQFERVYISRTDLRELGQNHILRFISIVREQRGLLSKFGSKLGIKPAIKIWIRA